MTKDQLKKLLLLTNVAWRDLKSEMKAHYNLRLPVPEGYDWLVGMPFEVWREHKLYVDRIRTERKEELDILRTKTKRALAASKKREYMRLYMKRRRSAQSKPDQLIGGQGRARTEGGAGEETQGSPGSEETITGDGGESPLLG